jgi:signal transduction histidine kinase
VTLRQAALEAPAVPRSRGLRPVAASLLIVGLILVVVLEVLEPLTWAPVIVLAYVALVAVGVTRSRADAAPAHAAEELEAELRDTIEQLRRSRARVAHVADTERRRIERDLHDGCQQRLIALRVKLALAEELVGGDDERVGELIREIAADAETALDDLHALVHGIYPPLLTDRGLADALKAMARTAPVRARVLAGDVGRYPADVEAAVYFICAEALQNAAKHGGPGATARVVLRHEAGGLAFEVRDDGRGFDTAARTGTGLANMEDRLAAVGGRLRVVSAPQCGAVVQGWVPDSTLRS